MQNNPEFKTVAYGKINLYLDVLDKREDGYHNIRSVMQTVSLCDTVTLTMSASDKNEIEIACSLPEIKCDSSNLVHRAARIFIEKRGIECTKFSFYIDKRIPVSAGMAGGSADAAATLKLLNEAFSFPYSEDELCHMGRAIGADVPFCIKGGTCICEGVGERLTALPSLSDIHVVSAIDCSSVSTPRAFALLDERFGTDCKDSSSISNMVDGVCKRDTALICSSLYNKFESVIIPEISGIELIKNALIEHGAAGALMSGSGPSVFGIFENEETAVKAANHLISKGIRANVCKTI